MHVLVCVCSIYCVYMLHMYMVCMLVYTTHVREHDSNLYIHTAFITASVSTLLRAPH